MKTLIGFFCAATVLVLPEIGKAQQPQPTVLGNAPLDGVYQEVHNPNRRVVPLANIREADVMWQKRIWRVIDLREKINQQLYYPTAPNANRRSLFDVFSKAALAGEIKAYSFNPFDNDDTWSTVLTATEVANHFSSVDTITDENGNRVRVENKVTSEGIRQYELKEDWIFDRQRSVLDVRILGLGPKKLVVNENTHKVDENTPPELIFWLYYPEIRPYFAAQTVFNTHNDAERRTLDDIFMKRQFSSYVIQESNVYNRAIAAYTKGLDALLEAERVHKDIAAVEHDMWQY